jgi:hypothetical protein
MKTSAFSGWPSRRKGTAVINSVGVEIILIARRVLARCDLPDAEQ